MNISKSRVYDLPTRLFHWLYAFLFVVAFVIAKTVDDDSSVYTYHMLAGILMAFVVLLRFLWGFIGSHYARFSSFKLNLNEFFLYFRNLLNSKTKRYLGHNPASSYAAMGMFFLSIGLVSTGFLMGRGINKYFFEDVHELFANAFLIVVIGHIAGVLFHQIKHRDGMIFSMLSGQKSSVDSENGIKSNYGIVAALFVILVGAFSFYLNTQFNSETGKLKLMGFSVQLGESEKVEKGED